MNTVAARKKWCPMARVRTDVDPNSSTGNRAIGGGIDTDCLCVADDCMMWVWDTPELGFCGLAPHFINANVKKG